MACQTHLSRSRRTVSAPTFASGVLLAAACTSFEAHATLECYTDEEAVIKCDALMIDVQNFFTHRKSQARCLENCAICASLPDDLTG